MASQTTTDDVPGRLEIAAKRRTQCRFCGEPLHAHDRVRRYPDDGPPGAWCYEYQCANGQEELAWSAARRPHLHG